MVHNDLTLKDSDDAKMLKREVTGVLKFPMKQTSKTVNLTTSFGLTTSILGQDR